MTITFTVCFCGMSGNLEGYFTDRMMLWKPFSCFTRTFHYEHGTPELNKVGDLISLFKAEAESANNILGEWGNDHLQVNTVYIKTNETLIGLQEDKLLSDIFAYFACETLEFIYIYIAGGASFNCSGYRFIIHPNEDIHRNSPHVHVRRDDDETRYSLDTLKRLPEDKFSRTFQRDEKKIILPYLKRNQKRLLQYWDHYLNGYVPPEENVDGYQYYRES